MRMERHGKNASDFGSIEAYNLQTVSLEKLFSGLSECNEICYKDPVLKDRQWSAYIDRSPGAANYSGCNKFNKTWDIYYSVQKRKFCDNDVTFPGSNPRYILDVGIEHGYFKKNEKSKQECFHACVAGCGYKFEMYKEKVDRVRPSRPSPPKSPPVEKPPNQPATKPDELAEDVPSTSG